MFAVCNVYEPFSILFNKKHAEDPEMEMVYQINVALWSAKGGVRNTTQEKIVQKFPISQFQGPSKVLASALSIPLFLLENFPPLSGKKNS